MDSTTPAQSILETLRTVEFRLGLKGYNVDEVDEYLEKAAVEAETVQEQLRAANERLVQANERIAQLELDLQRAPGDRPAMADPPAREPSESDDALQRTLVLAQRFVEQAKRESEAEATETVSRAEERARSVLSQAEERARQITTEAEQRLRDEVTRLESLRTRLAGDVEAMARHLEEQRTRIRSSLTEALKWIDERVQPAASLMTVRTGGDKDDPAGGRQPGDQRSGERKPGPAPEGNGAPGGRATEGSGGGNGAGERPQPPAAPRLRSLGSSSQVEELFEGRRPD